MLTTLFALTLAAGVHGAAPRNPTPTTPIVVELFTSEGCSSCPSADRALATLAALQPIAGVEIVPLSFHVDYWNYLGWRDPFSSAANSERQRRYATDGRIYTPQMIVDGQDAFVGDYDDAIAAATRRARATHVSVPLTVKRLDDHTVEVTSAPVDGAEVWIAVSESGLSVEVPRGENEGRTLAHTGVVRRLMRADGTQRIALEPAWKQSSLTMVAFAQRPGQGEIIGVSTRRL